MEGTRFVALDANRNEALSHTAKSGTEMEVNAVKPTGSCFVIGFQTFRDAANNECLKWIYAYTNAVHTMSGNLPSGLAEADTENPSTVLNLATATADVVLHEIVAFTSRSTDQQLRTIRDGLMTKRKV